jgi:mono/diheme cytochrome c family protein
MKPYQRVILTVVITTIAVIAAQIGAALAVMYFGLYNVSADHPHGQPIRWYLSETTERSVHRRARGLKAPAQVSTAEGFSHFGETCVLCHGAPGIERSEIGDGLSPDPPNLSRTANDWTVEQVYWIVKHGIGDAGMPAFGPTYEEPELWAIAYFVKQLPNLTPAEYRKLVVRSEGREE